MSATNEIQELKNKIVQFTLGNIPEDKFKHFRLTRGVYGQRQVGVQMIRIKLPVGYLTPTQLTQIADVSDRYSNGNLHLTTRQDIQLHYVKLKDSPQVWQELEDVGVTLRESCGNTVRNITASPDAGINPSEAFDVTPYALALTDFFLRNPISQDMGRKIKIAFSATEDDTALSFIHDLGFIARVQVVDGKPVRGFKVVIGGGLGAQPIVAKPIFDFLPEQRLIPFSEALIRVFDRHGERANRNKARLKYLVKKLGVDQLVQLVNQELIGSEDVWVSANDAEYFEQGEHELPVGPENYTKWLAQNTFKQKLGGRAVQVKVALGNINSAVARSLAQVVEARTGGDIRVTINQGLLIRNVPTAELFDLYNELQELGLGDLGAEGLVDISSCPGSVTCNLAVTNSTDLATELSDVVKQEYPDLLGRKDLSIKISGCMNSCGQHMVASFGLHGSSIKKDGAIIPAMQIVLGGGLTGTIAEKVIKVPSKRAPQALRTVLDAFVESNETDFNRFYQGLGKKHFYGLLKPLSVLDNITVDEYVDWGTEAAFVPEIGQGECAGVSHDVVSGILGESKERLAWALQGLEEEVYKDAAYNAYSGFVIAAKAALLSIDVQSNTQVSLIESFKDLVQDKIDLEFDVKQRVFELNELETKEEVADYLQDATSLLEAVERFTNKNENKEVIGDYYKA